MTTPLLWLIERNKERNQVGYDEVAGFVIRAYDSSRARELAAAQHAAEPKSEWLDSARSTCSQILEMGEERVILQDFNAG